MNRDLLDWIRTELAVCQPAALTVVEPVLNRARQMWGGDRVYVRALRPAAMSRRTMYRRQQQATIRPS